MSGGEFGRRRPSYLGWNCVVKLRSEFHKRMTKRSVGCPEQGKFVELARRGEGEAVGSCGGWGTRIDNRRREFGGGNGAEMARRGKFGVTGSRPDVERGSEARRREMEKTSIETGSEEGDSHVGTLGGGEIWAFGSRASG